MMAMVTCRVCGSGVPGSVCVLCGTPVSGPSPLPDDLDQTVIRPSPENFTDPAPPAQYPPRSYPPTSYPQAQYPPAPTLQKQTFVAPTPGFEPLPPNAPRRSLLPIVAGVAGLALIVVVVLVAQQVTGIGRAGVTTAVPTVVVTVTASAKSAPPSIAVQASPTQPALVTPNPQPTGSVTSEDQALSQLTAVAAAGRATIPLDGNTWVAELGSKYVGIIDPKQTTSSGSHLFKAADILAEHQALVARLPDAHLYLVDSRTFGKRVSFNGQPYYDTLATSPVFTSQAATNAWCASHFPGLTGTDLTNQCYARRPTP